MSNTRNLSVPLIALVALSILAAADGIYLMRVHIDYVTGVNTVAGACYEYAENGCSVTAGRFGSLMGIPVAAIGFAGALATLACAVAALTRRNKHHDPFRTLVFALASLSLLASAIMATFSLIEGSFCPFCVAWYGINAGLFAAAWFVRPREGTYGDHLDDLLGNGAFVPIGVFGAALAGAVLWHHGVLDAQQAEQDAEVAAHAPEIAEAVLAKNETFDKGASTLVMRDNPTKLYGGATAEQADVVIVEFGDFQCPFCKKLWTNLEDYLAQTDRSVRVHFAHYPLNEACNPGINDLHPYACQAAVASVCAAEQGKFWEYGDAVFENQESLDRDDLQDYAEQVGLDLDAFKTCLDDPKSMAQVRYDIGMGSKADITGTPTFFINGYPVVGAYPPPVLDEIIGQILAHDAENAAP
ncbi:MAG: DsbA family protein [Nannocystaceae bacterium]|nr:thioredoxin domain-containing protein [bacterium]